MKQETKPTFAEINRAHTLTNRHELLMTLSAYRDNLGDLMEGVMKYNSQEVCRDELKVVRDFLDGLGVGITELSEMVEDAYETPATEL